ncbi:MAG: rRNA maturation RNase YbeY [Deltaproteobacteria bacterium]|nr:rRNA maturation RNase YbeY [Deltaproteobacteria bacterium]
MKKNLVIQYEDETAVLPEKLEEKLFSQTIRLMGLVEPELEDIVILFCSKNTIQELNHQYRGLDKPTDILSFGDSKLGERDEQLNHPGELAVCLEICESQALEYGLGLELELLRLITHGILHLCGLDHDDPEREEAMLQREIKLLELIGIVDIY